MPLDEIVPYKKNPRKNDHAVDAVAASIREFGFKVPIVLDKDNIIVTGHTRLKAAKKLGLDTAPCIYADDLTPEQIKAFRLADNKVGELAEWDKKLLELELAELPDFSAVDFGFDLPQETEPEQKPEVEFAEVLGEANNYVVLQFRTEVDWLQAVTVFGLKTVKSNSTRRDGVVTPQMERRGVGRVIDGAKALAQLLGGEQ